MDEDHSRSRNSSKKVLQLFHQLAKVEIIPIQIIWGVKDNIFPHSLGVELHSIISQAMFHTILDAVHTPRFGQSEKLIQFSGIFFTRNETDYKSTE